MFLGVWLGLSSPPRWLLARGLAKEAWQSAGFVYVDAAEAADAAVAALKASAAEAAAATAQAASLAGDTAGHALGTGKPPLFAARNRRALVAGLGVVTLQQVRERAAICGRTRRGAASLVAFSRLRLGKGRDFEGLKSAVPKTRLARSLLSPRCARAHNCPPV
jgi:hypothetical protein